MRGKRKKKAAALLLTAGLVFQTVLAGAESATEGQIEVPVQSEVTVETEAPKQETAPQTEAPKQESAPQTEAPKQEPAPQTEAQKQEEALQTEAQKQETETQEAEAQTEASETADEKQSETAVQDIPEEDATEIEITTGLAGFDAEQDSTEVSEAESSETEEMAECDTADETEQATEEATEKTTEEESETEEALYHVSVEASDAYHVSFPDNISTYHEGELVRATVTPEEGYTVDLIGACLAADGDAEVAEMEEIPVEIRNRDMSDSVTSTGTAENEEISLQSGTSPVRDVTFTMPDDDVEIVISSRELAEEEDIRKITFYTTEGKSFTDSDSGKTYTTGYVTGPSSLHNSGTVLTTNRKVVRIKTGDGTYHYTYAYCMQPGIADPSEGAYSEGTGDSTFQILDDDGAGKQAWMSKALFYLYGGPLWNKTVTDSSGKDINFKNMLQDYDCDGAGDYFTMTHYIMSYIFDNDTDNWNAYFSIQAAGKKTGLFNDKGKECVKSIAAQLKKMPDPVTAFSSYAVKGTWNQELGLFSSAPVLFDSFDENRANIVVPSGMTLVTMGNTEIGARNYYEGQTASIHGGESFYLVRSSGTDATEKYQFTIRYGADFTPMKIKQKGTQDCAFAYYSGDQLELTIDWDNPLLGLRLFKSDAATGGTPINGHYNLAGAQYTLYSDINCTTALETMTTGADGSAQSAGVYSPGTYYLKETAATSDNLYQLNTDVIPIIISGQDISVGYASVYTSDVPRRVRIHLQKSDAETGLSQPQSQAMSLEGAVFGFYADAGCNTLLCEGTSDANGNVWSADLYIGSVWVKEIAAPQGYDPSTEVIVVSAEEQKQAVWQNADVNISVREKAIRGDVSIEKTFLSGTGKTKAVPAGVKFRLSYEDPSAQEDIVLEIDSEGRATTKGMVEGGTLLYGRWTITEEAVPEGYDPMEPAEIMISESGQVITFNADNHSIASYLRIEKKDADSGNAIPVAGVSFRILNGEGTAVRMTDEKGNETDTWTTDEAGTVLLPEPLDYGSYVLEETGGVPDGYLIMEKQTFTISENARDPKDALLLTASEPVQMGRILVKKTDTASGEALGGFEYDVVLTETIRDASGAVRKGRDAQGNEVLLEEGTVTAHLITGEDGTAETGDLYLGSYLVKETAARDGYARDAQDVAVVLAPDHGVTLVTAQAVFSDNPTTVKILKKDKLTGDVLSGAVFSIVRSGSGEEGQKVTTGKDGTAVLNGLLHGSEYIVSEVTAPAGFVKTDETWSFTVDQDGMIEGSFLKEIEAFNQPIRIDINKADFTTGEPVIGAVLVIRDMDGKEIVRWTTDGKPHRIERIPAGHYTLTEITAPEGYEIAETVEFVVAETGEIQKVTMYDRRTPIKERSVPRTGDTSDPAGAVRMAAGALLVMILVLMWRRKRTGVSSR